MAIIAPSSGIEVEFANERESVPTRNIEIGAYIRNMAICPDSTRSRRLVRYYATPTGDSKSIGN